jgi:hypothetical protein
MACPTYNLGIVTPEITSWWWLCLVDTGVSRVSNTGDGMELNDFDGLRAGRFKLRSSIKDVGMNGKLAEIRLGTIENKLKNEDKGGTWNQGGRTEIRLRTIEDNLKNEDKDGTWNQGGRPKVDRDSTWNNRGQAEKRGQR